MIKNLEVIGLIPARGNSKNLHRKNLLSFKERTLLEHAIITAKNSSFVDQIIVNSEDEEIIEIAKKHSIGIFERDPSYSKDSSTSSEVISDFIRKFNNTNDYFIIYLQPTSPYRNSMHIDEVCSLIQNSDENCAISVTQTDNKFLKSFFVIDGRLSPIFHDNYINANRQDLPEVYFSNGAIYIFRKSDFLRENKIPIKDAIPFFMGEAVSLDIDSLDDYQELLRREND